MESRIAVTVQTADRLVYSIAQPMPGGNIEQGVVKEQTAGYSPGVCAASTGTAGQDKCIETDRMPGIHV